MRWNDLIWHLHHQQIQSGCGGTLSLLFLALPRTTTHYRPVHLFVCVYGCRDLRNRGPNIFIPVCDWWLTWWWSPLTYTLWFNLFDCLILWSTFDDDEDLNLQFTQMTAHHVCGKLFLGSALCSAVLSLVSFRKLQKLNEWMNESFACHFSFPPGFYFHHTLCVYLKSRNHPKLIEKLDL